MLHQRLIAGLTILLVTFATTASSQRHRGPAAGYDGARGGGGGYPPAPELTDPERVCMDMYGPASYYDVAENQCLCTEGSYFDGRACVSDARGGRSGGRELTTMGGSARGGRMAVAAWTLPIVPLEPWAVTDMSHGEPVDVQMCMAAPGPRARRGSGERLVRSSRGRWLLGFARAFSLGKLVAVEDAAALAALPPARGARTMVAAPCVWMAPHSSAANTDMVAVDDASDGWKARPPPPPPLAPPSCTD